MQDFREGAGKQATDDLLAMEARFEELQKEHVDVCSKLKSGAAYKVERKSNREAAKALLDPDADNQDENPLIQPDNEYVIREARLRKQIEILYKGLVDQRQHVETLRERSRRHEWENHVDMASVKKAYEAALSALLKALEAEDKIRDELVANAYGSTAPLVSMEPWLNRDLFMLEMNLKNGQ